MDAISEQKASYLRTEPLDCRLSATLLATLSQRAMPLVAGLAQTAMLFPAREAWAAATWQIRRSFRDYQHSCVAQHWAQA